MSINRTDLPLGHAGMALPCFTARDASDGSVQMSLWNASPAQNKLSLSAKNQMCERITCVNHEPVV